MSELRRLTWKYFFKQKWKEIKDPLAFGSMMVAIILIMIGFGFPSEGPHLRSLKLISIGVSIFGVWVIYGIILIIKSICKWIKSNWVIASERAERELNPGRVIDLGE